MPAGCCTSLLGLVMSFWLTEPGSYDGSAPSRAKYAACDTAEGSYEGSTHRASSPEVPLVDGSMHSSSGDAFRPLQQHTSLLIASRQAAASSVAAAWQHVAEIGAMPGFWKFMCMCLITVNLKVLQLGMLALSSCLAWLGAPSPWLVLQPHRRAAAGHIPPPGCNAAQVHAAGIRARQPHRPHLFSELPCRCACVSHLPLATQRSASSPRKSYTLYPRRSTPP